MASKTDKPNEADTPKVVETEFFRRLPRQARSRELVARILAATRLLLERDGLQRLTTNHIAREAGIDIASLYQYFASKEAVLYTLLEQWVQQVQAIYASHQAAFAEQRPPLLASLRRIHHELDSLPDNEWNWRHLAPAVLVIPVLRELEAEHELQTTAFWTTWLRAQGVDWAEDRLQALARMLYVQADSAMTLAGRLTPTQGHWVRRWQRRQSIALLRECFPKQRR